MEEPIAVQPLRTGESFPAETIMPDNAGEHGDVGAADAPAVQLPTPRVPDSSEQPHDTDAELREVTQSVSHSMGATPTGPDTELDSAQSQIPPPRATEIDEDRLDESSNGAPQDVSTPGESVEEGGDVRESTNPDPEDEAIDEAADLPFEELSDQAASQEWLEMRFAGLEPADFGQGLQIFSSNSLVPPLAFQNMWSSLQQEDQTSFVSIICSASACLVLANPLEPQEMFALTQLLQAVDAQGQEAPPLFLAAHTMRPERRRSRSDLDPEITLRSETIHQMMEQGFDGVIATEPEGFDLALAVRSWMLKAAALPATLNEIINERREREQYVEYLEECTNCIMWDYLRIRLTPSIPPCDFELPPGEFLPIEGFNYGQLLGRRKNASTYMLIPKTESATEGPRTPCQAVRVVKKQDITTLHALKVMKRMIDVMYLLSSDDWRHPRIVQLFEIYHSPTHLYFRMELGGTESLYERLLARSRRGTVRHLSVPKAAAAIAQTIIAVAHLHTGPRVCHRDIKPENLLVTESSDTINIKLADFELALVQTDTVLCKNPCGTVPFVPPEVMLEYEYDGMAVDMWGLGVTIFEVMCGVRVFEQALKLDQQAPNDPPPRRAHAEELDENMAKRMCAGLNSIGGAGELLQQHCEPELEPLLELLRKPVDRLANVGCEDRWKAADALRVVPTLPVPAAPAP